MTDPDSLQPWLEALCAALNVDPAVVEVSALLDVARDAAHGVARPAAPLTTFVVGLAAGLRGGGGEAIADASAVAQQLALAFRDSD
jgi:Domain of unknown function (DUF6457)